MAKHEAVERLMALATEKRADRLVPQAQSAQMPPAPLGTPSAETVAVLPPAAAGLSLEKSRSEKEPAGPSAEEQRRRSAGQRGREFFEAMRPLLPAMSAAMRLIDHGAVQAVARLLPLLGGGVLSRGAAGSSEPEYFLDRLSAVEAALEAARKDGESLHLQMAQKEDELRRLRMQLERVSAEQLAKIDEFRSLADRVRLLTAGTIILLMLLIAQMILLLILFHR